MALVRLSIHRNPGDKANLCITKTLGEFRCDKCGTRERNRFTASSLSRREPLGGSGAQARPASEPAAHD